MVARMISAILDGVEAGKIQKAAPSKGRIQTPLTQSASLPDPVE